MTRFAVLSPPYAGHLNPMLALGRGLVSRGHHVTVLAQADVESQIRAAGIGFAAVGAESHPPDTLDRMQARLAGTTGLFGIGGVIRDVARTTQMLCRDGEGALRRLDVQAILADQTEAAGGLLARHLGLPQVSVANALLINREPTIPPPFVGWAYDATEWGIKRNRGGERIANLMMWPVRSVIRRFAAEWTLGPLATIEDCLSPTLQISQTVAGLDFPRREPPGALVHVGPLRDTETGDFEPRDGRPLVFCSLGTLQGARFKIFEAVARACETLDLSLAIAHGGRLTSDEIALLPGRPLVEAYLPQRAVMARAAAVVTHGGLNTVMDAAAAGVPMVVTPIAFEQSAIAARVERSGVGLVIPSRRVTAERLAAALERVLAVPTFRSAAARLKAECGRAGGVARAIALIEDATMRGGSSSGQGGIAPLARSRSP